MNDDSLGRWLRDTRVEKDISLRSLAAQLDIAPSYLSDIENDRRIPAEEILRKLTDALGLNFDDAMARAGRFGEDAERSLRSQPEAVKLFRRISAANLTPEQLKQINKEVERQMRRKNQTDSP